MTDRLKEKIFKFATLWLDKTGRESLIETLQGFDFVEDCYRDLPEVEQKRMSKKDFLDELQKQIAGLF